ncbi:MAG: helix-turn-helix domain-containing protein [Sphingorhabdus sp.]
MPSLIASGTFEFILPAFELRRYFSSYYFFKIDTADGATLDDFLHPEGPSARFMLEGEIPASLVPDPPVPIAQATVTGPTSRAVHIACRYAHMAGIGMLPLGWYKFLRVDASRYANVGQDVDTDPLFAPFAAIWKEIRDLRDHAEIAAVFDRHLLADLDPPTEREAEIERVHAALADADITDVADLAAHVGLNSQYLERLCRRVFGFPPKRLLRRQRFLRSLAPRLLDPHLKWTNVLDGSYHDQAHFNRDFRDFMGLSPRAYLEMPRPISKAAVRARLEALGQPLQVLQGPKPNEG